MRSQTLQSNGRATKDEMQMGSRMLRKRIAHKAMEKMPQGARDRMLYRMPYRMPYKCHTPRCIYFSKKNRGAMPYRMPYTENAIHLRMPYKCPTQAKRMPYVWHSSVWHS
jgi:hypothetical protein